MLDLEGWGHNLSASLCKLLVWALSFWMKTLRLVFWMWSKMVAFKICLGGCVGKKDDASDYGEDK